MTALWGIRCVWLRHFDVYRKSIVYGLVTTFTEPLLYLFSFGFGLGSMIGKVNLLGVELTYRQFILAGIVALESSWNPPLGDPLIGCLRGGAVEGQLDLGCALKNGSLGGGEYRAAAKQFAARSRNAPMLEDIGLLEAGSENYVGASGCFDLARTVYTKRDDILRTVLHEADALGRYTEQVT